MVLKIPICVLYSHMKKNHGWLYGEKDFKNWKGCLDGVLAERYAQRHKEYNDEGYGMVHATQTVR